MVKIRFQRTRRSRVKDLLAAFGVAAGFVFACGALLAYATPARAERVKDLVTFAGVRDNPLIGYGLVVGLDGTGDQTTQAPFTTQTLANMLANLGISINNTSSSSGSSQTLNNMQLKNVAAVIVTATLPPFARPGEQIDVTVSSLANAKSIRGGTLLLTPLKGADGQVYALAQGNVAVGGAGASANGSRVQVNQLAAGRISAGATVERAVPSPVAQQGGILQMEVNDMDYDTTQRIVAAVNNLFGDGTAAAVDGRTIQVRGPSDPASQVGFIAQIQNLDVRPAQPAAKVILNARTGSIVMNQMVTLESCAVAHGNLSVVVNTQTAVSQPGALSNGQTVAARQSQIQLKQDNGSLKLVTAGANLAEVVKALNALGATPADLMSILQAMKAAGALRADLEII
ncbi:MULTISPECIES: flagellar basal body P-ring protein FlgI [Paraburkholderia]|jgi:flagellar P-ring protein FlgI|uniref:Flagellar P-ring protein n=1 Tax=Paraburkholderia tropica TaxID=92647 RepID=A0A1A5WZS6_9BURK|nr:MULTISPECIES: flagellar basal body P-ring protein FlgI [Paraburkholderia]MBB2977867.1 flagellar P-ring protein precursor FlgI [Paraburkholderia tropica]MBB2998447.1 flagellar P-ring protein precursor FlgI [Paraburkholderia tropica]MBB6317489.1 flagellar P-ring protein precursor FlgI [Paraburkholderia tropica]MBN3812378.1 flagellar basal body P-ring protein FlgI [Paraburkholderia sp. Ac-20347]OBR46776.1 flagellar biosynthesis protein FlgI [Paraburkholderia tropica]